MNDHDEDDDLYFVDPCGWQFSIVCALVAVVLLLAGLVLKEVL